MTWREKRAKSYSNLDEHKNEISKSAYKIIKQTIGSHAIENMFLTSDEIHNLVRVEKGEISTDELVAEYINELRVS